MSDIRSFLLLFFLSGLLAGTWRGYIYSADQLPLEYAYIIPVDSDHFSVSDNDGFFMLKGPFSPGDSIRVERYGYETVYTTLPADEDLNLILRPRPIDLPAVEARGYDNTGSPDQSGQFVTLKAQLPGHVTQKRIFETLPGVSIRTYGGPGSVALLSIDGGVAPHTNVAFNGLSLNNAQTGLADVSQLPVTFFRSVRLNPDGDRDGTIAIYLWDKNTVQATNGSFGERRLSFTHSFPAGRHIFRLGLHGSRETGDFPVRWNEKITTRANNDFSQFAVVTQMDWFPSPQRNSRLFFFHSRQNRGNPGQVWSPSRARRADELTLASLALIRLRDAVTIKTIFAWKNTRDYYQDPDYALTSRHNLDTFTATLKRRANNHPPWQWDTQADLVTDHLESTAAGNRNIISIRLHQRLSYLGLPWGKLESTLRFEHSSLLPATTGFTLRMQHALRLRGNTGISFSRSVRNPSLNELYWIPGGNPRLKPETLYKTIWYYTITGTETQQFGVELYYKYSQNLIQWTPVTSFWTPVNIRRTQRLGIKSRWQWAGRVTSGTLVIAYGHSRNLTPGNEKGKSLLYAPDFIIRNTLNWEVLPWSVQWQTDYRGTMIARYDWPRDIGIDPMLIHALVFQTVAPLGQHDVTFSLQIHNVFNRIYEYTKGYPEMGRSIQFTLTFNE